MWSAVSGSPIRKSGLAKGIPQVARLRVMNCPAGTKITASAPRGFRVRIGPERTVEPTLVSLERPPDGGGESSLLIHVLGSRPPDRFSVPILVDATPSCRFYPAVVQVPDATVLEQYTIVSQLVGSALPGAHLRCSREGADVFAARITGGERVDLRYTGSKARAFKGEVGIELCDGAG